MFWFQAPGGLTDAGDGKMFAIAWKTVEAKKPKK